MLVAILDREDRIRTHGTPESGGEQGTDDPEEEPATEKAESAHEKGRIEKKATQEEDRGC